MKKEYKLTTFHRSAKPRSKRLQGLGGGSAGSTTVNITQGGGSIPAPDPNSHTHTNKHVLDSLDEEQGYLYLTHEAEDGSVSRDKARSGYADKADEADHSMYTRYLDLDSPEFDKILRKDIDDTANGLLTMKKGTRYGKYIPGPAGSGGQIDEHGEAELGSLKLRSFLETPEYRFNRVSVEVGNSWRAPGGGLIEHVVRESDTTGTIYLKLQEGERGAVEIDDICQGIFHDTNPNNNERRDMDDGAGNFFFKGFFTSYFRVTEILDTVNHSVFRYELRAPAASWPRQFHPMAAMNFVAYGNFSNTFRQTSRYCTRTYERYLINVNNWEFTVDMIGCQFGDLSNLTIFGIHMSGYSAFLNNIFMSGTIQQFEEKGYSCNISLTGGDYIDENEVKSVQTIITDGYGNDVTEQFRLLSVTRYSGNTVEDNNWNQDFSSRYPNGIPNPFNLSYDDMGFNNTMVKAIEFTVTAQDLQTGNILTNG